MRCEKKRGNHTTTPFLCVFVDFFSFLFFCGPDTREKGSLSFCVWKCHGVFFQRSKIRWFFNFFDFFRSDQFIWKPCHRHFWAPNMLKIVFRNFGWTGQIFWFFWNFGQKSATSSDFGPKWVKIPCRWLFWKFPIPKICVKCRISKVIKIVDFLGLLLGWKEAQNFC